MRDELQNYNFKRPNTIHKKIKLFSIFICILLTLSIFPLNSSAIESNKTFSFIIEFNKPSLLHHFFENTSGINNTIPFQSKTYSQFLTNISSFQQYAINKINKIVENEIFKQNIKQFRFLINAICIDSLSYSTVQKIEHLPFVRQIEKDKRILLSKDHFQSNHNKLIIDNKMNSFSSTNSVNISSYSGQNISIAFLDTGIDYTHSALSTVYKKGYDFVNDDTDPFDDNGHGTHVIGITAAQKTITSTNRTVRGIAPNASVYVYKVLDENGEGYTSWFLSALEHAMDPNQDGNVSDHMDIISISAGNPTGSVSDMLSSVAIQAVNAGISVVAAAGNKGPTMNTISSPAIAPEVIAVGASIQDTTIASYSSRGSNQYSYIKPDIIAPGHLITSTWPNNQYHTLSGTSMATPYITGVIACLLEKNPSLTPSQIQTLLHTHAHSMGYNETTEGYGIITKTQSFCTKPPLIPSARVHHKPQRNILIVNLTISNIQSNVNYSIQIYPIDNNNAHSISTNYEKTNSSHTIINFSSQNLTIGYYILQINLRQQNKSSCLKQIIHIQNNQQSLITYPKTITPNETFTCTLTNEDTISPTLFIFTIPFHSIQLGIGTSANFTAPPVPFSQKETFLGCIYTITFSFPPQIQRNKIILHKNS